MDNKIILTIGRQFGSGVCVCCEAMKWQRERIEVLENLLTELQERAE